MIRKYFYSQLQRNFSIATIWISGGSDMDSPGKKGLNQLLCSLLTRGCKGFNDLELSNFIESYGAELNHEVFEDGITISIKSLNSHFKKVFPLLYLIVNKPILSEMQFKIVKKSTLNSIKKEKENPYNICFEKWKEIVYAEHPYAYNSIGYEKDVSKIIYQDILHEYEKFKSREKFLISNNIFVKSKKGNLEVPNQKNFECQLNNYNQNLSLEDRFVSSYNESDQTIIMLGNRTCSPRIYDFFKLKILESHLSFGMSSVLFKLFRENNGITYDVGVLNSMRKESAPFLVYLSVSNENALLAFELLTKLWKKLLISPLTTEELFIAKEKLKSSYIINNQFLEEVLQRKIQLISYDVSSYLEKNYIKKSEETTPRDILKLTNKYFSKPILSVNGNKKICNQLEDKWVRNF